jgi:hypothetical protein
MQLPPSEVPVDYAADEDERGYGWVLFAGTLLLMLGTLNFIEGLAAINNSHFFVNNTHYIAGSLNTWGGVVLCIGVVEWCVGVGVFVKDQFSRWVGVMVLGLNAIVQLMMIPRTHSGRSRSSRSTSWRSTDSSPTASGSPAQIKHAKSAWRPAGTAKTCSFV